MDFNKIYVPVEKGGYTEYKGGLNFVNGRKKCTECNSTMERVPIGQQYINVKDGKIIVSVKPDGRMVVNKIEPDCLWLCTKNECNHAVSSAKNPLLPT